MLAREPVDGWDRVFLAQNFLQPDLRFPRDHPSWIPTWLEYLIPATLRPRQALLMRAVNRGWRHHTQPL